MPHTAPANPSLPQNDTPEGQATRAVQLDLTRLSYAWTTAVPSLPEVPVVSGMPANETPTLTWWVMLTEIFVHLIENHLAVQKAAIERGLVADTAAIAANEALAAGIAAEVAAIKAKIAHNTSGGTIWSRLEQDAEMELLALGEEGLAAKFEDHARKLCAVLELGVAKEEELGNAFPRSLETYRTLFQTIPLPGIAWCFQDDHEFARLRVAGPNPMLIKRIHQIPAKFPLSAEAYAAVVGGDTLAEALSEGRLYFADYHALDVLVPGSTGGQAKYVICPIALFAVPPHGASLIPVAIQCGQDPTENPLFTPSVRADEQWGWELAKLVVQVADGNWHELFAHLAHTHLVFEAVAVAIRRHLAEVHPLWALLVPHFEGTMFINYEAATSLITAGGPIDRIFAGTIASSQQMAATARLSFDFTQRMPPNDFKARGVDDAGKLPDYPYRDDALLVWQAIHEWVQCYVGLYYADDAAVTADTELAAWAADIAGEGQLKGFGPIQTRHQLIDCLRDGALHRQRPARRGQLPPGRDHGIRPRRYRRAVAGPAARTPGPHPQGLARRHAPQQSRAQAARSALPARLTALPPARHLPQPRFPLSGVVHRPQCNRHRRPAGPLSGRADAGGRADCGAECGTAGGLSVSAAERGADQYQYLRGWP